jgi:spore coat protein A
MLDRRRFLLTTAALGAPWSVTYSRGASPPGASMSMPMSMRAPAAGRPAPLHPETLARFVDALPIPPVARPVGHRPDPHDPGRLVDVYRIAMREITARVHRDLPPTRLWGYGGSVPGPTIETRSGRGLFVEWRNELPERHLLPIDHNLCGAGGDRPDVRAIVHVHGAKVPPESDGYPEDWYPPGHSMTSHYPNRQEATTLWYHDHAMGIERLNHYAGLFGLFLVRDHVEDGLHLPRGPFEVPLVVCDRLFGADGQLVYPTSGAPDAPWVPEVNGDVILVNGKLFPYLDVEPRPYRFRVVNASNSRILYLSLSSGQGFHQIGSDQGLLAAPVAMKTLTLAPAERADLIVDFAGAGGQRLTLQSQTFQLLQLRVRGGGGNGDGGVAGAPEPPLPARLRAVPRLPAAAATRTRTLTLNEYEDPRTHVMLMLLDGKRWHEPVTERPELGSVEIWSLVNLTEDTHPIHLHLVRFQILDREVFDVDEYLMSGKLLRSGTRIPPGPEEAGWKDTARAEPGSITRIIVRFEGYPGRYVWHCHLLEHAANEMMRPFEVVPRPA